MKKGETKIEGNKYLMSVKLSPLMGKERVEEVLKEIFQKQKYKIGIEDNGSYGYTIHLGNGRAVHTNDAGVEQFNKALQEYATKEWTTEEINKLIEEDPNKEQ